MLVSVAVHAGVLEVAAAAAAVLEGAEAALVGMNPIGSLNVE
jgi:hypothetical protein